MILKRRSRWSDQFRSVSRMSTRWSDCWSDCWSERNDAGIDRVVKENQRKPNKKKGGWGWCHEKGETTAKGMSIEDAVVSNPAKLNLAELFVAIGGTITGHQLTNLGWRAFDSDAYRESIIHLVHLPVMHSIPLLVRIGGSYVRDNLVIVSSHLCRKLTCCFLLGAVEAEDEVFVDKNRFLNSSSRRRSVSCCCCFLARSR